MKSKQNLAGLTVALLVTSYLVSCPTTGKTTTFDPLLTKEMQTQLDKAMRAAKSKHTQKALQLFSEIIAQADTPAKCLSIISYMDNCGSQLTDIRNQCLNKALTLSTNNADLMEIARKGRQYGCLEITSKALDSLINSTSTIDECFDLAHKAQEVALNDKAHMAMLKAYPLVKTVPEAIQYAKESKLLGMDDLVRRTVKDMIDDENNAHQLMVILRNIEQLEVPDLERYLFKKSLDKANTVDQFHEIWDEARRHNQTDIYNVAAFRGRKLMLIQKIKKDEAAYKQELDALKTNQQGASGLTSPSVGGF